MPYQDNPRSSGGEDRSNFNIEYRDVTSADNDSEDDYNEKESFDIEGPGVGSSLSLSSSRRLSGINIIRFFSDWFPQIGCCVFGVAMAILAIVIFSNERTAILSNESDDNPQNPSWPALVVPPGEKTGPDQPAGNGYSNSSDSSSKPVVTYSSSGKDVVEKIRQELLPISGHKLYDTRSDQYKAAKWLAENGPVPDSTMVEVYVLALFSFGMTKNAPGKIDKLLRKNTSPCNWNSPSAEGFYCTGNNENHVTLIKLEQNQLSGTLPSELIHLSYLTELSLDQNTIYGTVPTEFGLFSNLKKLSIRLNKLTGTIPTELGMIGNNARNENFFFTLAANELRGTIPSELAQLTMRFCYLNNNQLTGTIPTELGDSLYLNTIDFAENKLSGIIPTQLGFLKRLGFLWLQKNDFTGDIPTQFGNLSPKEMRKIELNSNRLIGTIPSELGRLSGLDTLRLQDNLLGGDVNHIFCQPTYVGSNENSISHKFKRLNDLETDSCDDSTTKVICDCCCCGDDCK